MSMQRARVRIASNVAAILVGLAIPIVGAATMSVADDGGTSETPPPPPPPTTTTDGHTWDG
jgi:hypothetical protein